ncbi:hypothetical protein TBK1r_26940 [Stieleria magnilauensis]|uniref:Uncharacterized protein n=1 Tax=Stieleria magnilauensis TaxID=2527963 RepID=A0ABX5XP30_9BACT|nr:hypothetical protein TBK1r_26940 [Planctomycetes bacterium TBK1r]
MKTFIAATALAGLIGVPAQAQAGCGCSGNAQGGIAAAPITAIPGSPYGVGASYYAGGYQTAAPSYQPAMSYQPAPVYSNRPTHLAAPYSAAPIRTQMAFPAQTSSPQPFASVPIAGNGSSCCANGGSNCCQTQAGVAPVSAPSSIPTTLRLSTSGDSALQTQSATPSSNHVSPSSQAPPMPMPNAAPATQSAPAVADPHAGHQH